MARLLGISLFLLTLVGLAGCGSGGGSGVTLKGTLLQNGKPITPPPKEDDTVEISLLPTDKDRKDFPPTAAVFNYADGTFVFEGTAGAGVVTGEVRILLRYIPYDGNQDDRFKEQFTQENSTLTYTITNDKVQEIVIDVGKKTVTKVGAPK